MGFSLNLLGLLALCGMCCIYFLCFQLSLDSFYVVTASAEEPPFPGSTTGQPPLLLAGEGGGAQAFSPPRLPCGCHTSGSSTCKVSALDVRSLIYLEFVLLQGVKYGSNFIFFQMAAQLSQHHLLKSPSLLRCLEMQPSLDPRFPSVRGTTSGLFLLRPGVSV